MGSLTLSDTVGRVFNDAELKLLSAFGSHASIAIRNARLHKELRVRLTQSETLLAVSKQVTATVDSAEMMRRLAPEIGFRVIGSGQLAPVALHFGADDWGGTLFEENVHKAADYVNTISVDEMVTLIREAGFTPAQRTTEYNILQRY